MSSMRNELKNHLKEGESKMPYMFEDDSDIAKLLADCSTLYEEAEKKYRTVMVVSLKAWKGFETRFARFYANAMEFLTGHRKKVKGVPKEHVIDFNRLIEDRYATFDLRLEDSAVGDLLKVTKSLASDCLQVIAFTAEDYPAGLPAARVSARNLLRLNLKRSLAKSHEALLDWRYRWIFKHTSNLCIGRFHCYACHDQHLRHKNHRRGTVIKKGGKCVRNHRRGPEYRR